MTHLLIYTNRTSERLTYIFDFILTELLGLSYELTSDQEQFSDYKEPKFSYATMAVGYEPFFESTPLLFEKDIHPQPINFSEYEHLMGFYPVSDRSLIPFDIFASAFFMITRYEEYLPGKKDKYDRYRGSQSMSSKGGHLEKPMIDYYALALKKILKAQYPALQFRPNPFEYILTFDVDMAFSYLHKDTRTNLGGFARSIILSEFGDFKDRFLVLLRQKRDPYDTYDYIYEIAEKHDLKTRFFFLLGDKSKFDKNVSYKIPAFREIVKMVSEKSETGIHLSFKSHVSNELMVKEIERLQEIGGNKVSANRFHYLRYQIPSSYSRLIKVGITEDHSMGYAGRVGFRAGTGSPYSFFNLKHNVRTPLRIYPFAFMDATFVHYRRNNPNESLEKIRELMNYVKETGGPFVGLWHNSSFTENKDYKGWRKIFETVAEEAAELMKES
ncbi:MAG: polysaccharide deacetylase family protein [Bacteroidetes bacterium]|nr:polysaccharide deacetylase family protein [Bacteroidota bacterium]